MSNFDEFLATLDPKSDTRPEGIAWYASIGCQFCGAQVSEQTLYPNEQALVWWCPAGHRGHIEGYTAF